MSIRILNPRTSECIIPLLEVDTKIKFGFFVQFKSPFGLYIRLPFVWARWGSA
jgi:hypothetical protein